MEWTPSLLELIVGDELYEAHLSWYHSRFIGDGGFGPQPMCMKLYAWGLVLGCCIGPTSPICWVLYVVWTSSLLELA